jgi:hypothetical protein
MLAAQHYASDEEHDIRAARHYMSLPLFRRRHIDILLRVAATIYY